MSIIVTYITLSRNDINITGYFSGKQVKARINEPLLPWVVAQAKCSWGVIILMGGGFALSKIITVR